MTLSREEMLDALMRSEAAYNGRFLTGVLSTGIYCLPGCRARKPKPENVIFFATPEEAEAAGLRPCFKCRPDAFYRGENPALEPYEALVEAVRAEPGRFEGVEAMAAKAGVAVSTLHEATRRHYQDTPAAILTKARVRAAQKRLRETDAATSEVALEVGFASLSAFHENFRLSTGMSPGDYRRLRSETAFVLTLPSPYPAETVLAALGRDPGSVTERREGNRYFAATRLDGVPAALALTFEAGSVQVEIVGEVPAGAAFEAHCQVERLLGLEQDPASFERLVRREGLPELVEGREGLRVPQTLFPFDALVWAIVGQQISLPFAFTLRRRFAELAGDEAGLGLKAMPGAERVASLDPADLVPLQFSRRKAEYLIDTARSLGARLETMPGSSATRVEAELLATRGLGPWAANYLMMRGLGFADCVPLGDTGLTTALQRMLRLDERPDKVATQALTLRFSPYRSLACYHLWQSLKKTQ